MVYNEQVRKSLIKLLFLRSSQDGGSVGAGGESPPTGQRFLLKWSVPLSLVEVVEFGSSEEMGDSARFSPSHSGEKVVINAKPSMLHKETCV